LNGNRISVFPFRHPDNFAQNESERKAAEKKFIDIAAAKEVLTDPEKRAEFDQGKYLIKMKTIGRSIILNLFS
jgi:DnaJ-class molecular chaperone